jgi:hypothetical protein
MSELVTYEKAQAIARIVMDDGKANVMSSAMLPFIPTGIGRTRIR